MSEKQEDTSTVENIALPAANELWGALAVCVILALLFYWEMIDGDPIFAGGDNLFFFIPQRQLWLEILRQGSFPLWNPHALTGTPLFAAIQPAILYPFSWLFLVFPFYAVYNLTIILHYSLAGFGMYCLLRCQRLHPTSAWTAALTFMFSGYLFSVHRYPSTLLPVAWAPFLLLAFFAGLRRHEPRLAVAAGGIGALMFFAGGAETCYQLFPLLALFSIWPSLALTGAETLPDLRRRLLYLSLFGAAFLGLAAAQLLPALELIHWSERRFGVNYDQARVWSLHFKDLLSFFMIDFFGYSQDGKRLWINQNWLQALYLGMTPFLFAALFAARGGKRVWTSGVIILVSAALALGHNLPSFDLLRQFLPLFASFRYPVKFILLAALAIALAAGLGCEESRRLAARGGAPALAWRRGLTGLGLLAILIFGAIHFAHGAWTDGFARAGFAPPRFNHIWINLGNIQRLLAFTALFCLALVLHIGSAGARRWPLACAVALLGIDLFFAHHGLYRGILQEEYAAPSANLQFLQKQDGVFRVYIPPETEQDFFNRLVAEARVDFDVQRRMIRPLMGIARGISYLDGVIVMRPHWFESLRGLIASMPPAKRLPLLNLLNVRFLLSANKLESGNLRLAHLDPGGLPENIGPAELERLQGEASIKIYENPERLERAHLFGACQTVASVNEYQHIFSRDDFDPRAVLLLEESPPDFPCGQPAAPTGMDEFARVREAQGNFLTVETRAAAKKLLFVSDALFPGWEAFVDGKPVKIYRADYAFRAVVLAPGTHAVRFVYNPGSFRGGAAISLAAALAAAALWRRGRTFHSTSAA